MTGLATTAARVSLMCLAAGLAACGSGSAGLTTGSLLPGNKPPVSANTSSARVEQAAATSARATKCGYNFDAAKLRTAYLAYESTEGGAAEQMAKLEKSYDSWRGIILAKSGSSEEYCSEELTEKVKKDLNRNLAGDFAIPEKKVAATIGPTNWWGLPASNQPLDREKVFDPNLRR